MRFQAEDLTLKKIVMAGFLENEESVVVGSFFSYQSKDFSKLDVIDDPDSVSSYIDALPTAILHKTKLFENLFEKLC